jgi:putative DNA primase/helicase
MNSPRRICNPLKLTLNTVLSGDQAVMEFLQRYMGYCMTGYTTEQVLVFLYGTGGNGKGVFTKTMLEIFGDYAVVAPIELLIASKGDRHPTEIAKLRGARLVVATETQEGRAWDEVKLKLFTGSDRQVHATRFLRLHAHAQIPNLRESYAIAAQR